MMSSWSLTRLCRVLRLLLVSAKLCTRPVLSQSRLINSSWQLEVLISRSPSSTFSNFIVLFCSDTISFSLVRLSVKFLTSPFSSSIWTRSSTFRSSRSSILFLICSRYNDLSSSKSFCQLDCRLEKHFNWQISMDNFSFSLSAAARRCWRSWLFC